MIPVMMLKRQLMFEGLGPFVTFTTQALQSNLFGLACPFYCTSPAIGTLLACFLFGVAVGLTLAVYLLWLFAARFGFCPSGLAPSSSTVPERPPPPVHPQGGHAVWTFFWCEIPPHTKHTAHLNTMPVASSRNA